MNSVQIRWALFSGAAILAGSLVFVVMNNEESKPQAIPQPQVVPAQPVEAEPVNPSLSQVHPEPVAVVRPTIELEPKEDIVKEQPEPPLFDFKLPKLEESDAPLLEQLKVHMAQSAVKLLVSDALVERFVTSVNAVSQGQVTYNQLPVERPSGSFKVIKVEGILYPSSGNINRYQPYVELLTAMPREQTLAFYQHTYPLLQQAYERLGNTEQSFHQTLLLALDQILATPTPQGILALHQPKVTYEYVDSDLQNARALDKLMLRLGPDMNQKVKLLLSDLEGPLKQWQPK